MKFEYHGRIVEYVPLWGQEPASKEEMELGFARLAMALAVCAQRAAVRALEEDELDVLNYAVEVIAPGAVEPLPAENRIILAGKLDG
jgi:hypothetical protein